MATYDELKAQVEDAKTSGDKQKQVAAFLNVFAAVENEPDPAARIAIETLLVRETGNGPELGDESDQTPVADIDVEDDE